MKITMTKSILLLLIGAFVLVAWYANIEERRHAFNAKKIVVIQDKPQEWADALKLGLYDGLRESGLSEGKDYIVVSYSAAGNPHGLSGLSEMVARGPYQIVYTLGTQTTQAIFSALKGRDIDIVFGAVTDPLEAGFFDKDLNAPLASITGTQDLWPYPAQFDLIGRLLPNVKKIGILYNSNEINSQVSVQHIRAQCNRRGIRLEERTVVDDAQVLGAASGLLDSGVDALFIPADNTAQSAANVVISEATQKGVPVFTGIPGIVENGAIATVGTDYYELGRVNASQIARILGGEAARNVPVQIADKGDVYINARIARELGIQIPEDVKARAVKVYD